MILASSETITEAAKLACAHDFIMSLGQGYATKLSERGSNLSGGQGRELQLLVQLLQLVTHYGRSDKRA